MEELVREEKDTNMSGLQHLLYRLSQSASNGNSDEIKTELEDFSSLLVSTSHSKYRNILNLSNTWKLLHDVLKSIEGNEHIENRKQLFILYWKCISEISLKQPLVSMISLEGLLLKVFDKIKRMKNNVDNEALLLYYIRFICWCTLIHAKNVQSLGGEQILYQIFNNYNSKSKEILSFLLVALVNICKKSYNNNSSNKNSKIVLINNGIVDKLLEIMVKYHNDHSIFRCALTLLGYIGYKLPEKSLSYVVDEIDTCLCNLYEALKLAHRANPPSLTGVKPKIGRNSVPPNMARPRSTTHKDHQKPEFETFKKRQKALVNHATRDLQEHRTLRDSLAPLTPATSQGSSPNEKKEIINNINSHIKALPNQQATNKFRDLCTVQLPIVYSCIESLGCMIRSDQIAVEYILSCQILPILLRCLKHEVISQHIILVKECVMSIIDVLECFRGKSSSNDYTIMSEQMLFGLQILTDIINDCNSSELLSILLFCSNRWLLAYHRPVNSPSNNNMNNDDIDEHSNKNWKPFEILRIDWQRIMKNKSHSLSWGKIRDKCFESVQMGFIKQLLPAILKCANKLMNTSIDLADNALLLLSLCCALNSKLTLETIQAGGYETVCKLIDTFVEYEEKNISNDVQSSNQYHINLKKNKTLKALHPDSLPKTPKSNRSKSNTTTPSGDSTKNKNISLRSLSVNVTPNNQNISDGANINFNENKNSTPVNSTVTTPASTHLYNGEIEMDPNFDVSLSSSTIKASPSLNDATLIGSITEKLKQSLTILSRMVDIACSEQRATLLLVSSSAARQCWKVIESHMTDDEVVMIALKALSKLLELPTLLDISHIRRNDPTKQFRHNRGSRLRYLLDDNVGIRPYLTVVEDVAKLLSGYSGSTNLRIIQRLPSRSGNSRNRKCTIVLALATSSFRSSAPVSTFDMLNRKSPQLATPNTRHIRSQTLALDGINFFKEGRFRSNTITGTDESEQNIPSKTLSSSRSVNNNTSKARSNTIENNKDNHINNDIRRDSSDEHLTGTWPGTRNLTPSMDAINMYNETDNNNDPDDIVRNNSLSPFNWTGIDPVEDDQIKLTTRLAVISARFVLSFIRALSTTLSLQKPTEVREPNDPLQAIDYALFLSLAPHSSFTVEPDLPAQSMYALADIMEFILSYMEKCQNDGDENHEIIKLLGLLKLEIVSALQGLEYLLCGTGHLRMIDERHLRRSLAYFRTKVCVKANDKYWKEVLERKYDMHFMHHRYHEVNSKLHRSRSNSDVDSGFSSSFKRHRKQKENIRESLAASSLLLPVDAQLCSSENISYLITNVFKRSIKSHISVWSLNYDGEVSHLLMNDNGQVVSKSWMTLDDNIVENMIKVFDKNMSTPTNRPSLTRAASMRVLRQATSFTPSKPILARSGESNDEVVSKNNRSIRSRWKEFLTTSNMNKSSIALSNCNLDSIVDEPLSKKLIDDDNVIVQEDNSRDSEVSIHNDKNNDIKWENAIKLAKSDENPSEKLRSLIFDQKLVNSMGIPSKYRSKVWIILSGSLKERRKWPKQYYRKLVGFLEGTDEYSLLWRDEIRKDVHRTLPDEELFKTAEGRASLERVLSSYVLRNPETIGYCQGMNLLAGTLLTQLNEEDAFWVLVCLIESRIGYYNRSMCGLKVDQLVLEDVVAFTEPEIADKFRGLEISLSTFTVSWFLCLFVESPLNVQDAIYIWDHLFLMGDEFLFSIALSLLKVRRNEILCLQSGEELLDYFLHGRFSDNFPLNQILTNVNTARIPSILLQIDELRHFHRHEIVQQHQTLDNAAAQNLRNKFHFDDEEQVQRMWRQFLSAHPWDILLHGGIAGDMKIMWFHRAFCPIAFPPWHRRVWRDGGIFAGVIERLFDILDSSGTGTVSFDEFCTGIYICCKGSRQERMSLAFQFCDIDGDGQLSLQDLTESFTMLHEMYCGRHGNIASGDAKLFAKDAFSKALRLGVEEDLLQYEEQLHEQKIENSKLDFDAFSLVADSHPFVNLFFGMDVEMITAQTLANYFREREQRDMVHMKDKFLDFRLIS